MNTIIQFFRDMAAMLPIIKFMDVVDILVVALLIYLLITKIRTTGAARIVKSIIFIVVLYVLTLVLDMYLMNYMLEKVLDIGLIALLIMFQPELRQMLEKIGGKSLREILSMKEQQREIDRVISQTVTACEVLSKEHTGALIVFERNNSLGEYMKSGTMLDAQLSSELLRNLFFTKAALHDGAVLVCQERIAAAGCVLPLTQNRNLSSDLGTRHRAGIGMSEATDAVVVIVSEETGAISVAIGGMLKRHLAAKTLERLLLQELGPRDELPSRNLVRRLVSRNSQKGKGGTDDKK